MDVIRSVQICCGLYIIEGQRILRTITDKYQKLQDRCGILALFRAGNALYDKQPHDIPSPATKLG
jgi:hypothetical protein